MAYADVRPNGGLGSQEFFRHWQTSIHRNAIASARIKPPNPAEDFVRDEPFYLDFHCHDGHSDWDRMDCMSPLRALKRWSAVAAAADPIPQGLASLASDVLAANFLRPVSESSSLKRETLLA
jgi:hypothetical protein